MENLLKNDYTAHYGITTSSINNISLHTNAAYFELEDDDKQGIRLYEGANMGTAIFNNSGRKEITIINYDKFVTSLPNHFQRNRARCDVIVYTRNEKSYYLLGELKDANIKKGRKDAKRQLKRSLNDLSAVVSISGFISGFGVRRCCIFNKRLRCPEEIDAVRAFNRLQTIIPGGMKLNCSAIEIHGFELWEYLGDTQLNIN